MKDQEEFESQTQSTDVDPSQQALEDSSIEKVRELLFGKQVAKINESQAEFAEITRSAISELNQALTTRMDTLKVSLEADISEKYRENQLEHTKINEEIEGLNHDLQALDKRLSQVQEEIYDRIHSEVSRLSKELDELHDEAFSKMNDIHAELKHQKTDRKKLAGLFMEMANSLNADD